MKRMIIVTIAAMMSGVMAGCGASTASSDTASVSSGAVPEAAAPSSASSAPAEKGDFDAGKMITVVSREDGSGTRGAFIELVGIQQKKDDGSKVDMTTEEAVIVNKTDVMLANVAGDDYAIGYLSLGSLNDTVKALDIDGAKASAENVKNGSYKVARPFNIATKGEATGLAKDFISFVMSAEGQAVVEKSGYIKMDDAAPAFSGGRESGKLVIAGSSSVSPVMEKLKEAYIALNSSAEIEIQQSDSTAGMTAAIDGTCDIGMASRELKDSEKEALTPAAIANDGIAVIVSTKNPATALTTEQVKAIFTGEVELWNEVTA